MTGIFFPTQTWHLVSANAGRIQEIPVLEGQYVLKGNLLIKIEDEKLPLVLERQRSELKAAESKVERDTQLAEGSAATPSPLNPGESPTPEAGEVMNELVRSDLSKDAEEEQAESPGLSFLQKVEGIERKQKKILVEKEASHSEFFESQLRLEEAQANRIKAEIALTEKQISETVITSILDGVVAKLSVAEGASVKPNDPLAEVHQVDPIELKVNLPIDKIDKIEKGMKAKITLENLPGQEILGEISFLGVEVDKEDTFEVRIRVANPSLKIKTGMKGNAEIAIRP